MLAKKTSLNYWREENNLIPLELNIQNHSTVTYLGTYLNNNMEVENDDPNIRPIVANFETIAKMSQGKLIIK